MEHACIVTWTPPSITQSFALTAPEKHIRPETIM
jgi:hypothetical protein